MKCLKLLRIGSLIAALSLTAGLGTAVVDAQEQHPNLERGYEAEKAFEVGEIDRINLFNGNLLVNIPIGGEYKVGGVLSYRLQLVYNSKAWDWTNIPDINMEPHARATPAQDSNAGIGWQLHFGKLKRPFAAPINYSGQWIYVGQDGAEHSFFESLHQGEPVTANYFYTRDNTYLRLQKISASQARVDFPSGVKHTFTLLGNEHFLTRMEDQFGNWMTITYPTGATSSEWQIADSTGRQHKIFLVDRSFDGRTVKMVSRVDLAAFGNQTATYLFNLQTTAVDRPLPHDPTTGLPINVQLPVLTRVSQPDGSFYDLPLNFYTLSRDSEGISGQLNKIQLPTRGMIGWTYTKYLFATDSMPDPAGFPRPAPFVERSPGIKERRTFSATGSETGKWTYSSQLTVPVGFPTVKPVEKTTTVVNPLGHKTVHYFGAYPGSGVPEVDPPGGYGLPFSTRASDGAGRFLSQRTFEAGKTTPSKVEWVRYYQGFDDEARLESKRTEWDGRWKTEDWSDFDGLGNYRNLEVNSDYKSGGASANRQISYTQYNPARGTYPGTFNPIQPTARWIHSFVGQRVVTEAWGTVKSEYGFDGLGFLTSERIYKNTDGTRHNEDTYNVYVRDQWGNLKTEKSYGGYYQPIGTGNPPNLAAIPETEIELVFEFGQIKTKKYKNAPFFLMERTIDRNTGKIASSWDVSGIRTDYVYDKMGRLTWEKPESQHDAWKQRIYTIASGSTNRARVGIYEYVNGSTSNLLREQEILFDELGRVYLEKKYTSAGWTSRRLTYDSAGNLASQSEWQSGENPSHYTDFRDYDPFGRAFTIQGPDGKIVRARYWGDWGVQRWWYIGRTRGTDGSIGEQKQEISEDFDTQGRLWRVQELYDPNQRNLDVYYTYTAGGQLAQVKLTPPSGASQYRYFDYDGRGFQTREVTPERGEFLFKEYNSRGKVHRKEHPASGMNLGYGYDEFERMTSVFDRTRGNAVLKSWAWASTNVGNNFRKGKVETAINYNHRRAPNDGAVWVYAPVKEIFTYAGRGGRVSAKSVQLNNVFTFNQSFVWDELGNLKQEGYPRCATASCSQTAAARTVNYTYNQGDLVGVTGWATLTYHDNHQLASVAHVNGVTDWIDEDPWQMPRPYNIRVTTPGGGTAQLGNYSYDGGGNLVRQRRTTGTAGSFEQLVDPNAAQPQLPPEEEQLAAAFVDTYFLYDSVGRIAKHYDASGISKQYDYDAFGNLIKLTDPNGSYQTLATSPTTNRLTSLATYDARGNMTGRGGTSEVYDWDLFDQMASRNYPAETFLYNTDGERLWTLAYNPGTEIATDTFTLRGSQNQVLSIYERTSWEERDLPIEVWSFKEDYIYRNNALLAKTTGPAASNAHHFTLDHLGTPRLTTLSSGLSLESHHYFAHGDEFGTTMASSERMRFGGHEKDAGAAGSVDDRAYMHARYHSPTLGRFMSVDPVRSEKLNKPQSWNLYAYALNSGVNYVDPNGETALLFHVEGGVVPHSAALFEFQDHRAVVNASGGGSLVSVSGFINHYLNEGRAVTVYVLSNNDSRDSQAIEHIHSNPGQSYRLLTNNCATQVEKALVAGGELEYYDRPSSSIFFDNPNALKEEVEQGALESGLPVKTIIFTPANGLVTPEQVNDLLKISDRGMNHVSAR